jgi:hypothetical protein
VFPITATRDGHGIGKPEGNELDEAGEIAVRQITALVPAEESEGAFLIRERTRPAVLVGHQFPEVFAFGSRRHALGAPVSDPACCSDFVVSIF